MAKFIKSGKVAVVVRGRFAGKKVVIVSVNEEGSKTHPFPHAIVAGIEKYPAKVNSDMDSKTIAKNLKVKTFVKAINYNHIMPTRYTFDVEAFKSVVTPETIAEPSQREEAKNVVKEAFEERHQAGKNKWFFSKLDF
ncbi:Ribosomal 60S subunit protein L27B [Komagataella phaffii CBS 7435]|uniref:Ribosomal 60S subunit protein L27B n=1 Tax=Komagataella phaffii (strain ATCC 76273 / CBS 7435 / CECT 11047 / NRRL Y-11430 / Wegner 21-1) TaxID=981350 RepID=A0A1G4KQL4_KOMPC|nr:Ribosomal 60S subunit protein L27B [Komagataella phaffii CBS 7435]SCV12299.1 Ribosomal 60S subunit protein L27B [Komagataella phaffii CBS 7435]